MSGRARVHGPRLLRILVLVLLGAGPLLAGAVHEPVFIPLLAGSAVAGVAAFLRARRAPARTALPGARLVLALHLQDSIELRHANFISFWINDLAAPDPTYVSPLLMGASMFYQQKMTPSTADPAQAKMMLMMPIVFTFMFLNFPAGLVLYWLVNNVLSIIQQFYINKKSRDAGGSEWTQSKSKPKPLRKQSQ